jgi:hypothetical protein
MVLVSFWVAGLMEFLVHQEDLLSSEEVEEEGAFLLVQVVAVAEVAVGAHLIQAQLNYHYYNYPNMYVYEINILNIFLSLSE